MSFVFSWYYHNPYNTLLQGLLSCRIQLELHSFAQLGYTMQF